MSEERGRTRHLGMGIMALVLLAGCGGSEEVDQEGDTIYTVDITAADFVEGVDNPYCPLVPGAHYVYEARMDDGEVERTEIDILSETQVVNGVTAMIFHDRVFSNGELHEDTHDWFAQDSEGNVWYLGETVDNYVDGAIANHAGAWMWGEDGALPGVIMWADPLAHLNAVYFQEYYPGEAEDQGEVLGIVESVTVPAGTFTDVLQTADTTLLEPGVLEHKFYAPGVGVIKEVDAHGDEEVLLIEYSIPGQ